VQICIWPSWCHCHSLSLAPVNPDWFYLPGFMFLVLAYRVVLDRVRGGRKMFVVVKYFLAVEHLPFEPGSIYYSGQRCTFSHFWMDFAVNKNYCIFVGLPRRSFCLLCCSCTTSHLWHFLQCHFAKLIFFKCVFSRIFNLLNENISVCVICRPRVKDKKQINKSSTYHILD